MASTSREPYREKTLGLGHKIFLSYSGADQTFLWELYDDLIEHDYIPFFDQKSLPKASPVSMGNIVQEAEDCKLAVFFLSESFFTRNRNPMMELVECVKKGVKLLPLFYEISVDTIEKSESWYTGVWSEWGVDGEEFKLALDTLLHMSGIENREGWRPREFRRKVLEEIHKLVPPDIRPDVSDVYGADVYGVDRLVMVVKRMFAHRLSEESDESFTHPHPAVVLGLHGASGTGKSTLCKMLEHSTSDSHCRVCRLQLDSTSKLERMKKVLKAVTNLSSVLLDKLTTTEVRKKLSECKYDKKVFLIIDNVIPHESMEEAKSYLRGCFKPGSKVLVTAHTEAVLSELLEDVPFKRHIDAMPDLEKEEATEILLKRAGSLFHSSRDLQAKDQQEGLVERCLDLCRFQKAGEKGEHYHPLLLSALGESLVNYLPDASLKEVTSWISSLKSRVSNENNENVLPELLRSTSYNLLDDLQKQVFLDVALYLPEGFTRKDELFQWLRLVHGSDFEDSAVWNLKRRGLIDGSAVSEAELLSFPLMHDLYYKMATLIVQDKGSECLFIKGDGSDKEVLPHNCQQLKRIGFEDCRFPDDLVMSCFPSVEVLDVRRCLFSQKLDLRGAARLRSLRLETVDRKKGNTLGLDDCDCLAYLSATRAWIRVDKWGSLSGVTLPTFDPDMPATSKRKKNHFAQLRWLNVGSDQIDYLDLDVGSCIHVETLQVCDQPRFVPRDLRKLKNLRVFHLECHSSSSRFGPSKYFPLEFGDKIERISIEHCDHVLALRSLSHSNCTSLRELHLKSCSALNHIGLGQVMSLAKVSLECLESLTEFPTDLLWATTQLQHLSMRACTSISLDQFLGILSMHDLPTHIHLASIRHLLQQHAIGLLYDPAGPGAIWSAAMDPKLWEKTLKSSPILPYTISNLLQRDFEPFAELVLRFVLHLCVGGRYWRLGKLLSKPHVIEAFSRAREPYCLLLLALANGYFGADLESHASSVARMVAHTYTYPSLQKCAASIVSTNSSVANELPSDIRGRILGMVDSSYDVTEQLQYYEVPSDVLQYCDDGHLNSHLNFQFFEFWLRAPFGCPR